MDVIWIVAGTPITNQSGLVCNGNDDVLCQRNKKKSKNDC